MASSSSSPSYPQLATTAAELHPSHSSAECVPDQNPSELTGESLPPRASSWPDKTVSSVQNTEFPPLPHHCSTSPVIATAQPRKPSEAGLHLQTTVPDALPGDNTLDPPFNADELSTPSAYKRHRPAPLEPTRPSITHKNSFGSSAASPSSSVPSPALAALNDITPLPSPINLPQSPDLWKRVSGRPHSGSSASIERERAAGGFLTPTFGSSSPGKKKVYPNLGTATPPQTSAGPEHGRSISDYVPDPLQIVRPRTVTGPSAVTPPPPKPTYQPEGDSGPLHREAYLARERGSVDLTPRDIGGTLPSPPPSNREASDEEEEASKKRESKLPPVIVKDQVSGQTTVWQPLKILGTGSFSEVFLAIPSVLHSGYGSSNGHLQSPLVAIKMVSHHSGTDVERMDTSIKREIEILQSIKHPCLPQLYAFEDNDTRALLVLSYCVGGDLFELASQHRSVLRPGMIQRIFSELVGAVLHLHGQYIVHRDIKLENVLLNLSLSALSELPRNPQGYPHPLITLTDLGLSKQIPPPPASPLLTHPCGSVDYAAPEVLLGQPYDGRATDAWALGVLLYALMECRLPFDPLPEYMPAISGSPARRRRKGRGTGSTVKHRIARCDWLWWEFGDDDGDWLGSASQLGQDLLGARECVEGLLKKVSRGRWTLEKVGETRWVVDGIQVEGGLKR